MKTTMRLFHNMDITEKPIADVKNTFMQIKYFLTGNYNVDDKDAEKRDYHIGILDILTLGIYPLADIFFEYIDEPSFFETVNPFYILPVGIISIVMGFSYVLLGLIKEIIGLALSVPLTGLVTLGRTISFASSNDINTSIQACRDNVNSVINSI